MSIFNLMTGGGNDELTLRSTTFPNSGLHLDFGAGADIFNIEGNVNWTLTDTTLNTTTPGIVRLAGIVGETANFKGGAGANVFNVSDWHGSGRLAGEGGNDTAFLSRDGIFTFGETFLNVTGGGSYTLSQMEFLELIGGPGVNTFIDMGWNGKGNLRGQGGNDMIALSRDSHVQLGNNFYLAGNNVFFGTMGLDSVEIGEHYHRRQPQPDRRSCPYNARVYQRGRRPGHDRSQPRRELHVVQQPIACHRTGNELLPAGEL